MTDAGAPEPSTPVFALLTQMGTVPVLGAAGITVGGAGRYLAHGRSRTNLDGTLGDILVRRRDDEPVTSD